MVCTLRCWFLRSTGWCYLPFCGHFLKDFCVIPPFKNGISLLSVVSILYTTRRRSISCARRDQNLLLQLTEYWKIPLQRSMPNRVKNSQRHIHMNNLNYHRKIFWWNNINLLSGTIYKIKSQRPFLNKRNHKLMQNLCLNFTFFSIQTCKALYGDLKTAVHK